MESGTGGSGLDFLPHRKGVGSDSGKRGEDYGEGRASRLLDTATLRDSRYICMVWHGVLGQRGGG